MGEESMRVSDADRDQAVIALREHLLAGRLTLGEFSDRVGTALQATTRQDLACVQDDLPVPAAGPGSARRRPARLAGAVLSHVVRRGRLRVRGPVTAVSVLGDLDLDLRDASIDRPRASVTAFAVLGNVDIYVPEGVNVDVSGVAVLGHHRDHGRDAGRPDAPVLQVRLFGVAGTMDVWRVPHDLRDSSYSDIFRQLEGRERRQLPS